MVNILHTHTQLYSLVLEGIILYRRYYSIPIIEDITLYRRYICRPNINFKIGVILLLNRLSNMPFI